MPKLTDTQLVMLSAAAQRADGAVELSENPKGAAAQKAAARLLREGLVEEVLAGRDLPAWRRDASDQPVALLITALGKGDDRRHRGRRRGRGAGRRRGGQALGQDPPHMRCRDKNGGIPPMIDTKTAKSSRTNRSDRTATRQRRSDAKKKGRIDTSQQARRLERGRQTGNAQTSAQGQQAASLPEPAGPPEGRQHRGAATGHRLAAAHGARLLVRSSEAQARNGADLGEA